MDLFNHAMKEKLKTEAPLAARMRPRTLDEYVGQAHIVGPGKLLRRAIEADRLFSSIILWGPPGTGKTTLAMVIANQTQSHFETLSAVLDGKPRLREVVSEAIERRRLYGKRSILFIDLFPDFIPIGQDPKEVIRKYFIPGDLHWNEEGHRLVARRFLETLPGSGP